MLSIIYIVRMPGSGWVFSIANDELLPPENYPAANPIVNSMCILALNGIVQE
jgi:hypothetical protein